MSRNELFYGIFIMGVGAVLLGTLGVIGKLTFRYVSPFTATFFRSVIGVGFLLPYLLWRDRNLFPETNELKKLFPLSMILASTFAMYFLAVSLIDVSIAILLEYTAPFYVLLVSSIFLNENLTSGKILAAIVAFFGIVFIIDPLNLDFGLRNPGGYGLALMAGLLWGLYFVLTKHAVSDISPVKTTVYTLAMGIPLLFILALIMEGFNVNFEEGWPYLLVLGVGPTGMAYLLYSEGIKRIKASQAGIVANIEPLSTVILAFLILHESIGINVIVGMLLIFFAISWMWKSTNKD
jgi:DME family drug/metabolite transporter